MKQINCPESPRRVDGFTLIEALVVISIIALLIAILMPALRSAREVAQGVRGLSNMRQIGIGIEAYANDFDDQIGPRYTAEPSYSPERYWASRLYVANYINAPDIFFCPVWPASSLVDATDDNIANAIDGFPPFRAPNQTLGMRNWTRPGFSGSLGDEYNAFKKRLEIVSPSEFFIVADSSWLAASYGGAQGYGLTPGNINQAIHTRHSGSANTLFIDGHAVAKQSEYFLLLDTTQGEYMNGGQPFTVREDY